MENSKKLVDYTGTDTSVVVPTAVSSALVREINTDVFEDVDTVTIDTYANDIPGAPWGAQNVVWNKEPKCTISFDANGGTGTMADRTANIGIAFKLPENEFTAPSGKKFKNWLIGSSEYAEGANVAFADSTNVLANWSIPTLNDYTWTEINALAAQGSSIKTNPGSVSSYWLRSAAVWRSGTSSFAVVHLNGSVDFIYAYSMIGMAPCFCI